MNAHTFTSDVAFTPTVKAIQTRKGSRKAYARVEERGGWQAVITPDLAGFIEAQTSVFLSTANGEGQPYIQHRGGPAGFLKVLDEQAPSALPISPATGSSSRRAIWPTTPRLSCS